MTNKPSCNDKWHIFAKGLAEPGEICECGEKQATKKFGQLVDAPQNYTCPMCRFVRSKHPHNCKAIQ
jgi:threonine dehydrogenase-like Zn-dependent dehydrogenase